MAFDRTDRYDDSFNFVSSINQGRALEYQALIVGDSLKKCVAVNEEIRDDKTAEPKDRRDSSALVVEAQIATYEFLKNGPMAIKGIS